MSDNNDDLDDIQNDELDFVSDFDDEDEFDSLEEGETETTSFKEILKGSPLLKIFVAVVVAVTIVFVVKSLTSGDPVDDTISVVNRPNFSVEADLVDSELDTEYVEAVKTENERRAKVAEQTGGSAMPTPMGGAVDSGLTVESATDTKDSDPLKEWRRSVEAARELRLEDRAEEEILGPEPDVVPLVQPVRPQPVEQISPEAAKALSQQMRTVISTQQPGSMSTVSITTVPNQWQVFQEEAEEAKNAAQPTRTAAASRMSSRGAGGTSFSGETQEREARLILPAGEIFYVQLLTDLNSDVPGPALATVLSGPFVGGRALGEMSTEEDLIVITYNAIIKNGVSYEIESVALDEATTLPAMRTDIDNHYFSRVILPAAAAFVQNFGQSLAQTGTQTTTTAGGGVATEDPEPSTEEALYAGLDNAAQTIAQFALDEAPQGPTIYVARGTTMGVLLLSAVTTEQASR